MKRVSVIVALALVVGVGLAVLFHRRTFGDGPVFAGAGTETGQRLDVAQPFSFGYVLLRNTSKSPARLLKVRLLGMTGGLELLGIRGRPVPDGNGHGMFLEAFGFPPDEWASQPLADLHVVPVARSLTPAGTPNEGLELVIGVRATRPGVARARAVEFTYRVGGRRYRETYDGSMYLCAPKEQFTDENCPGDAHGKFDDASAEVKVP